MLAKEKIKKYEEILGKEKKRLTEEIKQDKTRLDFGNDIDNFDEEADEAEELGNELGVEKIIKERMNRIDMALNRIQEGTYGICEGCGKEIPEKVLLAAPESTLCDTCKNKRA